MPKKKKNPKKPIQRWKLYEVSGNKIERKNKFCPKCGTGTYLGQHKDRVTCGSCSYTEFTSKKPEQKKE